MIKAEPTKAVPAHAMRAALQFKEMAHLSNDTTYQMLARSPIFFVPQPVVATLLELMSDEQVIGNERIKMPYTKFIVCVYGEKAVMLFLLVLKETGTVGIRLVHFFPGDAPTLIRTGLYIKNNNWYNPQIDESEDRDNQIIQMYGILTIALETITKTTPADCDPPSARDKARLTAKGIQGWTFKVVELPKPVAPPAEPLGGTTHRPAGTNVAATGGRCGVASECGFATARSATRA